MMRIKIYKNKAVTVVLERLHGFAVWKERAEPVGEVLHFNMWSWAIDNDWREKFTNTSSENMFSLQSWSARTTVPPLGEEPFGVFEHLSGWFPDAFLERCFRHVNPGGDLQGRLATLRRDYSSQLNWVYLGIPPKLVVLGWGVSEPKLDPDKWLKDEDNECRRVFLQRSEFMVIYINTLLSTYPPESTCFPSEFFFTPHNQLQNLNAHTKKWSPWKKENKLNKLTWFWTMYYCQCYWKISVESTFKQKKK